LLEHGSFCVIEAKSHDNYLLAGYLLRSQRDVTANDSVRWHNHRVNYDRDSSNRSEDESVGPGLYVIYDVFPFKIGHGAEFGAIQKSTCTD
jgi:hypothetical protein